MEVLKKQKLVICGYWVLSEHKPLSENAFIHKLLFRRERRGWTGEGREGKERAQYFFCFLLLPTPVYTPTTYQIQNVFYVVCITAFKNFDGGMV